MKLFQPLLAQSFDRTHADEQMLVDAFAVELVRHPRQLDLAVQWLIAHAKQRAVGHPKTEAVGGNCRALHVQGDRSPLAETAHRRALRPQLPVAIVGAGHRAGAHDAL